MPKVPSREAFQVRPNVGPTNAMDTALTASQATTGIRQIAEREQAGLAFSSTMTDLEVRAQERANELRVRDATNKAKDAALRAAYDPKEGFMAQRGEAALNRPSGKPLADEYAERFDQEISAFEGELGNDVQREMFRQQAEQMRVSLRTSAAQHMFKEFNAYEASVLEGTVSLGLNEMAINYNNPTEVDRVSRELRGAVGRMGELSGKSAEWVDAKTRETLNAAHATAMKTAIDRGDIDYAKAYLDKYKEDMDAGNVLQYNNVLEKEFDNKLARDVATNVVNQYANKATPSDFDRVVHITLGSESNFRRYDDKGNLLEGPPTKYGTAKGEMQVLDTTNKDPGYGVTPARDDSPEERARVGRDYLGAMIKKYGGDLAKAWAGYNYGPDNTDKALAKAEKEGQPWINYVPKETQDYVAKNLKAYQSGAGREPMIATRKDAIDRATELLGADRPERLKTAIDLIDKQFTMLEKDREDRDTLGLANAYQALAKNGGDFSALPPAVREGIPPQKLSKVMTDAKAIAEGTQSTNQKLKFELTTDPARLASMTQEQLWALRGDLAPKDFEEISKKYATLTAPGAANAPGSFNTEAINNALDSVYAQLGVVTAGTDKDYERMNLIRGYVEERLAIEQQAKGRMLNDVEVKGFVDALTAQSVNTFGSFLGFNWSSQRPLLMVKKSNIPPPMRDRIERVLQSEGVDDPTDDQVVRTYWRFLMLSNKRQQTAQNETKR